MALKTYTKAELIELTLDLKETEGARRIAASMLYDLGQRDAALEALGRSIETMKKLKSQ